MKLLKNCKEIPKGTSGIYMITSPSGRRYIGQSRCIKTRLIDHKCPSRLSRDEPLYREMLDYGLDTFLYEILERCEVDQLNNLETTWISKLNPEFNNSSGGFGSKGTSRSAEFKELMSIKSKEAWLKKSDSQQNMIITNNLKGRSAGYNHSEETKLKISSSLSGKRQSKETKLKRSKAMSVSMLGNKNGSKKVASCLNGVIVNRFDSLIDAAKSVNVHPSGITKVLNGHQNSAGGFQWVLLEK